MPADPARPDHPHSLGQSLALAARVVARVLGGSSTTEALAETRGQPGPLRAAAQDLAFNALRAYGVVDALAETLLDRPATDPSVRALLYVSLGELVADADGQSRSMHAVVHQAVEAASLLGLARVKGLVNAVLRSFLRESRMLLEEVRARDTGRWNHPRWWIARLRQAYPDEWQSVLAQSNVHPPMCLRVNVRRVSQQAYLARLHGAGIDARALGSEAILLERPRRVEVLPGFADGDVSVQDAGAQLAAHLLDVPGGARILDACAAPGGKSAHILELAECDLCAIDISQERIRRISENLSRLRLTATLQCGDARRASALFSPGRFDRILADVPCTASGVVRRHPDMRWLRRESDIAGFASTQREILEALWPVLAPGGKLLYSTCSVFPEENHLQIARFLERHQDATLMPIGVGNAGQLLPGPEHDGFYYALISRNR